MSSVREQILEALATKLATVPDATFFRSRANAVAREEGIAILLGWENEPVEKLSSNPGGIVVRNLLVNLSVLARGDPADQVADPVVVASHAVLMADPILGGLCSQIIEHGSECKTEEADLTAVEILVQYHIRYATRTNDLTTSI